MDLSTCWQSGFISTSCSTQTATEVHVLDSLPDIFLSFPPFTFLFLSLFLASVGTKVNQVWELGCSFPGFVPSGGESDCCAVYSGGRKSAGLWRLLSPVRMTQLLGTFEQKKFFTVLNHSEAVNGNMWYSRALIWKSNRYVFIISLILLSYKNCNILKCKKLRLI